MDIVKISSLKGICSRHYKRCMAKYKASFGPRSILAAVLERFCESEGENEVTLRYGWWEFLKKQCVPKYYKGSGIFVRKFNCLDCGEYFNGNPRANCK